MQAVNPEPSVEFAAPLCLPARPRFFKAPAPEAQLTPPREEGYPRGYPGFVHHRRDRSLRLVEGRA
jgi:hypothetical protein